MIRSSSAWVAATCAAVCGASTSLAQSPSVADLVASAQRAEGEARPKEAAELYRQAMIGGGSSRLGHVASVRLEWLEARSVDDYRPLTLVLTWQSEPVGRLSASTLEARERDVSRFPAGIVRREARAWLAASWREGAHDPVRSAQAYEALLREPGITELERRSASSGLARARFAAGDSAGAIQIAERSRAPELAALRAAQRRSWLAPLCAVLLAAFVLGCFVASRRHFVRSARRAVAWRHLAAAAWVFVIPGALAAAYDRVTLDTFALLGALGAIVCLAASFAGAVLDERRASTRTRLLVLLASLVAAGSAGYLALGRAGVVLSFG